MNNRDIRILVVDDEATIRNSLYKWFVEDGFRVDVAENGTAAIEKLSLHRWDIVLLDIKMPGMDGLEVNRRIQKLDKNIIVILITAYASVDTAVQAMKDRAYDYISKPVDPDDLNQLIRRAVGTRLSSSQPLQREQDRDRRIAADHILGESPQIKNVLEKAAAVARTDATVMIRGESGTGKELVALSIHGSSHRRYAPIISVNCGAFPETLLESELFGHEKGAYTGAGYRRKGILEQADRGTVFFDEIGTVSEKMQVDLLRVVESKKITHLGGEKPIQVDFRIISASNQDLEQAVADGAFREDLYFRLNVFTIDVPPLRQRQGDIPILARHFVASLAQSMGKPITDITDKAVRMLEEYPWPGNVRELRNVIERAVVVCKNRRIETGDLSFPFRFQAMIAVGDSLKVVEKAHIQRILERSEWNISRASHLLEIDRTTLYSKIKKYAMHRPS